MRIRHFPGGAGRFTLRLSPLCCLIVFFSASATSSASRITALAVQLSVDKVTLPPSKQRAICCLKPGVPLQRVRSAHHAMSVAATTAPQRPCSTHRWSPHRRHHKLGPVISYTRHQQKPDIHKASPVGLLSVILAARSPHQEFSNSCYALPPVRPRGLVGGSIGCCHSSHLGSGRCCQRAD